MLQSPYRKEWSASTSIAKSFIGTSVGSRIPTVKEYAELFSCSRGIVQNALAFLEERNVIVLEKQGKKGTFLIEKNEKALFACSGLTNLTASMPPPLNLHLAGLATGICQGMNRCEIPFTFAFVQGAKNRAEALLRGSYDFVVTTQYSAKVQMAKYEELEIAFPFIGCEYSLPYKLYINKPGKAQIEDGMTIAVDPTSSDQIELTRQVCADKKVHIIEMPLISSVYAFYKGEVDCIIFRDGLEDSSQNLLNSALQHEHCIPKSQISVLPLHSDKINEMQIPVALVSRKNYGIDGILKNYISDGAVSDIQKNVLSGKMAPQFY